MEVIITNVKTGKHQKVNLPTSEDKLFSIQADVIGRDEEGRLLDGEVEYSIDNIFSLNKQLGNKMAVILTDEDASYIPVAVLVVDRDTDLKELEDNIRKVKDEMRGEWQLSDIIEGISTDFKEFGFECISI